MEETGKKERPEWEFSKDRGKMLLVAGSTEDGMGTSEKCA